MFRTGYALVSIALLAGTVPAARASVVAPAGIPFNEALNFSYNPLATGMNYPASTCCDYENIVNSAPVSPASSTYSKSGAWGSVEGFASADLSQGQLKVRSAITVGDGSVHPSIQTNAAFGDSFTAATAGGAPFTWTANAQAAFNLKLNGTLSSSAPLSTLGPDAFVILTILQPGTLDPTKPLINGPTTEQYFYWNIGNPSAAIYYNDPAGNHLLLTPTASFTDIPQSLSATFNPDGNFDWVLFLGASGQIGDNVGDYFDIDLSHTLTLSYAGPDGSVTTAGSGMFANFDATLPPSETQVPEPATWAMFGSAILGLATRRRRRG